ncbi:MAG: ribosomal protein S18P -alanine acetyltransferase [Nocardioidaceae bacterium]|nr:ribosomal protein S18P -alanine acetyltransferase [Nocardioidaceae bacterium]
MTLRLAVPGDAAAVRALEVDAFGGDAWSEAAVAEELASSTRVSYVWVDDGELRGYAIVMVVDEIADLQRIAVAPSARRSGLGRRLLEEVVAVARRGGCERMLLEVRADNVAAIALYAACGFVEIHRRRGYYRDGVDAVVMQLGLGISAG